MKVLKTRNEIAEAINLGKYPVVQIDVSKKGECGLIGSDVRIYMGEFSNGDKFLERAQLKVYSDEKLLTFTTSGGCILRDKACYSDIMEDLRFSNSPVIKPYSEFLLAIFNSCSKEFLSFIVVETLGVSKHCFTPIEIEKVDMSQYFD